MKKSIEFQNKKIAYQISGKGNAVVLVHGFMESSNMWQEYTEMLQKKFQVISIDMPGHGESESISEVHSMEMMANCIKAVVDYLEVKECILLGHSMGGYVISAFAEAYPDVLRGLIFLHSHPLADSDQMKENRERTIEIVKQNHKGFITSFFSGLFSPKNVERLSKDIIALQKDANEMTSEAIIAALEGMKSRKDRLSVISELSVPILSILGKDDSRISLDTFVVHAAQPKHAEIFIMENVGHMGFLEEKHNTLKTMWFFIEKSFV